MKKTIKPILMLLFLGVSFLVKGQMLIPSTYSGTNLTDNSTSANTIFPLSTPNYLSPPVIGHYIQRLSDAILEV